ncbi:F-box/FBD/LRR-repeat protein At1g13570-like isoform X1 [Phoenix dactylifera]|uniref:F-box/FBD/LRR-repeat protein At1g13570-like isoform X1 n=2 Tax=Phoenix dactylifera TaxID=42345 RepID=A0A8B7CGE6_PHODC|nr:F-box/FBD/LRR-repeat protein At1g13570-like isoform X1 [Phoenix dactylifera]
MVLPIRRGKFEMEDRISTLPSNIIEAILLRLPIADAVRSSVLSSRWRYEWSTIPHLIFDKHSVPLSLHYKLDKIVDQVLLLHSGPIHKFVFDGSACLEDCSVVNRWITVLSRNSLKELVLRFCPDRIYKLPSTLFFCKGIVILELHDCEFRLPRVFEGFGSLCTLSLENVVISDNDFATLISKCSLLEKVAFMDFYGCSRLRFNAPNLRELIIDGLFEDIYLENTPDLAILSVGLDDADDLDDEGDSDNEDLENKEHYNFMTSLNAVPKIENLSLRHNMLELLAGDSLLDRLPTYSYLKKLYLTCVNFEDTKHIAILRCLFRSAPVLEELTIEADSVDSSNPAASFWEGKECADFRFNHLRYLTVTEILGVGPEMELIEFVLANSPVLETLFIRLDNDVCDEVKIYKQIMRFRRASTRAEIINLD